MGILGLGTMTSLEEGREKTRVMNIKVRSSDKILQAERGVEGLHRSTRVEGSVK